MRRNVVFQSAMINIYGKERIFVEMLSLFSGCFFSAYEVQLNVATMICIKCGNEENSRSVVCG